MTFQLSRNALRDAYNGNPSDPNAGLLLRRGMAQWQHEDGNANGGGEAKEKLLRRIADTEPSLLYRLALQRWQKVTRDNPSRFGSFCADLIARMYIGLNRESALETGVTVQHVYGMPMIPGSAVKGLTRACFREWLGGQKQAMCHLFGNETGAAECEAGGVVFHDAWWVPGGRNKPFVNDIVTPHHREYYGSEGKADATDFDSPVPAPQLAVQGSFYFAIEGDPGWTALAAMVLRTGLANRGIGGKRSSGYGFFTASD